MAMYVIADLHLQTGEKKLLQAFQKFVQKLQPGDKLFILGDLFNFFVGVDPRDSSHQLVKATLKDALQRDIQSFFIHGNRDFLMNQKEAAWFNMKLLPDVVVQQWGTHQVLLGHGDLFCTNDTQFMKYHAKVSQPWLQCLFRSVPLFIRRHIANRIRNKSQNADIKRKNNSIYGVVDSSISAECQKFCPDSQVDWVIHGHLHEFGLHLAQHQSFNKRYVLGAWWNSFSYLRFDSEQDQLDFKEFPLSLILEDDQFCH